MGYRLVRAQGLSPQVPGRHALGAFWRSERMTSRPTAPHPGLTGSPSRDVGRTAPRVQHRRELGRVTVEDHAVRARGELVRDASGARSGRSGGGGREPRGRKDVVAQVRQLGDVPIASNAPG